MVLKKVHGLRRHPSGDCPVASSLRVQQDYLPRSRGEAEAREALSCRGNVLKLDENRMSEQYMYCRLNEKN